MITMITMIKLYHGKFNVKYAPTYLIYLQHKNNNKFSKIKVQNLILFGKFNKKFKMKFYYDLLSQPSRALYIFFKLNNIPTTYVPVALRNAEHLTDEFRAINRFQKVPCVVEDDGFKLSESVAIFRFVMATRKGIQDHWYPTDIKSRALVDEYLEWQHNNTRITCALYFQSKWLFPLMTGKPPKESHLKMLQGQMEKTLDSLENIWLESAEKTFLAGNEISFADILAACELEQPKIADYDPFNGRPKLTSWYERVKKATNPYYEEAHAIVNKIVNSNKNKPKL
jgi:glutathione S-transferase